MAGCRILLVIACLLGATGVATGAYNAHVAEKRLLKLGLEPGAISKKLANCDTAVRYQMFHALAVLAIASSRFASASRLLRIACFGIVVGVCMFAGGLYSLVFFDRLGSWMIIPGGGLVMIISWLLAAIGFGLQNFGDQIAEVTASS